MKAVLISRPS